MVCNLKKAYYVLITIRTGFDKFQCYGDVWFSLQQIIQVFSNCDHSMSFVMSILWISEISSWEALRILKYIKASPGKGPFAVVDEHLNTILPNCFDAIGLMLMIRIYIPSTSFGLFSFLFMFSSAYNVRVEYHVWIRTLDKLRTQFSSERPITVTEVEPIVKDFASRWKAAIELMHNDVITSFSNFLCGMEILRAALTQLLLYYTRLSDCNEENCWRVCFEQGFGFHFFNNVRN
ncbi:Vacuolar protein sorting-associated protein 52 A [Sesamum angolense]|uniref:Vacuolar protein sorting-associated protein 52 A n=1 Tax=Sesamum angolense TaxID=2727404 RepID=A0AAE1X3L7_9LAMI|nr:Vacuolar protein sorting-associated protein 52 A [Sesamum angolense]